MPGPSSLLSRRTLLRHAVKGCGSALLLPQAAHLQAQQPDTESSVQAAIVPPVLLQPDLLMALVGDVESSRVTLARAGDRWTGTGSAVSLAVHFTPTDRTALVSLESPVVPVQWLHLRWHCTVPLEARVLGDAWERSYGDLEWKPLQAERVLPWYAMIHTQRQTSGLGVKTGAACFAFWQVDSRGISLWLDVRNGSNGVRLGPQKLQLATLVRYVSLPSKPSENAFSATQALCRHMVEGTSVPQVRGSISVRAIYGSNDWYYAYGKNTPAGILRDADLVQSLSPSGPAKPFTVIDDGYQDPVRFPDMPGLAAGIRQRGVLPGIWIRPLRAPATTRSTLLLPNARWHGDATEQPPFAYDPTIPEALEQIGAVATQACEWGFDLIKHDFTTFELFGQWGSQMGASPTRGDWHFDDRSLTNAQIVTLLYQRLRTACGQDRIILGCNTIGHLSVGLFDASRTGDDVSGVHWERTRRTGVNTLAFRLPQHRTFFSVDADCVPITRAVPWTMTRQWLDAVAGSGTVLLVSPEPGAVGDDQRKVLRDAFALCVQSSQSEPLDWLTSRTPAAWLSPGAAT